MSRFRAAAALAVVALFAVAAYYGPLLRWLYPIHYGAEIARAASRYELDPFLLAAIIRVESNFNPAARSPRGARGLMQLMPETARWIAAQQGRPDLDAELLHEPALNVELGAWYLRSLRRQFGENLVVVLAAYNGGRGNVERWLQEKDWNGRADQLAAIPFPETRRYVRRVLGAYEGYRRVYGGRFPHREGATGETP